MLQQIPPMQKQRNWRSTFVTLSLLLIGLLAGSLSLSAQAPQGTLPPHQAKVTWTNGVDPSGTTITGSNVYRCPGSCTATSGTFSNLTSTPLSATTTTYVDSAVTANTGYSYCVSNLVTISTGPFETPCSAVVSATIPKDPASPPSGLAVTAQ